MIFFADIPVDVGQIHPLCDRQMGVHCFPHTRLYYQDNLCTGNAFVITWILHQIFMFFINVELLAG